MAKKTGRPPGSQNKVGRDEKEFIKGLLGETQDQFRKQFMKMAEACDVEKPNDIEKSRISRFLNIRMELSKMVVPKPVEIDANVDISDFEQLLGYANQWNDEKG